MYLTADEISTHLYGEVTDLISRGDSSKLEEAIDAATDEAKGYLSAYDTDAIFAATGTDRAPVLLLFVKDIAVWHYIQLANPAVEMQLRLDRYEKAVKWLEKVQSGKVVPQLAYKPVTAPDVQNNYVKWGGNIKRRNYYN